MDRNTHADTQTHRILSSKKKEKGKKKKREIQSAEAKVCHGQ